MPDDSLALGSGGPADEMDELRAKAKALEEKLYQVQRQAEDRIIKAELKAEALRAGIVDLDGLRLLDASSVKLNETGDIEDGSTIMAQFRKAKPWLFGVIPQSAVMSAPPALPIRHKHATEMTPSEYAAARAALLKQRR